MQELQKKKIAIMTQAPLGTNYGNTVQNYALQFVLKRSGYHPVTMDRVKSEIYSTTHWSLSQIKNHIFNLFDKKNRLTPQLFNEIFRDHLRFVQEHIDISERLHSNPELILHFNNNNYDAVIVGSDQTWRPAYSPNIYNFFLDFLSGNKTVKKIAYASSFGTSEWEFSKEETDRCADLVQEFDAVSVREESGVALCSKYLKTQAQWVLDPTFLLTKEDYLAVAHQKSIPKRSGVFSYILDENDAVISVIDKVQQILELDHFTNQPLWRRNNKEGKTVAELKYPSVEGWLKAFDDADFVVTNSFHGTVFCIIFNKPFLTIVNKERGAARFHSLLNEFDLAHRLVEEGNLDIENILLEEVDFTDANLKIEKLRADSLEFLLNSLIYEEELRNDHVTYSPHL